ncbi:MAG: hypothetical protein VZR00_11355, partial [Lachnospiraceae bacterium]|nr:hypothetical protein [Lachnospiraceae bacterium]
MKNRIDGMTGMAIAVIAFVVICAVISAKTNDKRICAYPGCDNECEDGSDYCYLHEDSEDGYFSNKYTDSDSTSHSDYNSGTSTDSDYNSGASTYSDDNSETSTYSGNSFKDSDSHSYYHDSYD